jgi:AcrR family transcriptional regulator
MNANARTPARATPRRERASKNGRGLRRRDEARELFRNAILEAAEEVFSEHGFHAARIHDVAARARMGVGTIYNHFGQKEDVLRALVDDRGAEFLAAIDAGDDDPADFEGRLTARLSRAADYVTRHRAFFRLAVELGLLGGATAVARQVLGRKQPPVGMRARASLKKLAAEGVEAGHLAPRDPDLLARLLGSTIRMLTLYVLEEGKLPPGGAAEVAGLFVRGATGARPRSDTRAPAPAKRSAPKTSRRVVRRG